MATKLDGWIIFQMTYLSFLCIFGTIGNLLVILAVLTTPSLRYRSNFFIVVLAICDLGTCLVSVPFYVVALGYGEWPFPDPFCIFVGYFTVWSLGWSVTTLALIAVNRYLSITRPRHSYDELCSYSVLALASFGQFLLGMFIIMLPPFLGMGSIGFNDVLGHCSYKYDNFKDWIYVLILFLTGVISTSIILPLYYAMTFYIVRKSRLNIRKSRDQPLTSTSNLNQQSSVTSRSNFRFSISPDEIRLTKKLVLLFAFFLCCWLPYSVVIFCDSKKTVPMAAQRVTNMILWSNSAVNPFLYAWMMRKFRLAYKRLLTFKCFKRCRQVRGCETSVTNHTLPDTSPGSVIRNQGSVWL